MRSYFNAHKRQVSWKAAVFTGECPLCRQTKPMVQDHSHATGLNRDFICTRCNVILGIIESGDAERYLAYVQQWSERHATQGGERYTPPSMRKRTRHGSAPSHEVNGKTLSAIV